MTGYKKFWNSETCARLKAAKLSEVIREPVTPGGKFIRPTGFIAAVNLETGALIQYTHTGHKRFSDAELQGTYDFRKIWPVIAANGRAAAYNLGSGAKGTIRPELQKQIKDLCIRNHIPIPQFCRPGDRARRRTQATLLHPPHDRLRIDPQSNPGRLRRLGARRARAADPALS